MKKINQNKSTTYTLANIFLWVFIFSFSLIEYSYADSRFPILRDSKEQVQQGKLLYDQNCAS
jgi:hypothetical protein